MKLNCWLLFLSFLLYHLFFYLFNQNIQFSQVLQQCHDSNANTEVPVQNRSQPVRFYARGSMFVKYELKPHIPISQIVPYTTLNLKIGGQGRNLDILLISNTKSLVWWRIEGSTRRLGCCTGRQGRNTFPLSVVGRFVNSALHHLFSQPSSC